MNKLPDLCLHEGCRKLKGHPGAHNKYSTEAWRFFQDKDAKKLTKAGFATPRGGAKGAYQNHVVRSNKVIIPYERLESVDLNNYRDGYNIRLLPEQYFEGSHQPRAQFQDAASPVKVGKNAFVLYRTYESLKVFPPMRGWKVRSLRRDGVAVSERGPDVNDVGHYVLRFATAGQGKPKRSEGPPQGLFATEYADEETNFLCKCVLAWLIIQAVDSPYTLAQAGHLKAILAHHGLGEVARYENAGVLRHGLTCCPLCLRLLNYRELHEMIGFEEESGLQNAAQQVEGATRSTIVNLFHLRPLIYHSLVHIPENLGWGHAICNTRLGQRPCYSLNEIIEMKRKVGFVFEEGIETFGWMSKDSLMIRSADGAVWIQISTADLSEAPHPTEVVFDAVAEPMPPAPPPPPTERDQPEDPPVKS